MLIELILTIALLIVGGLDCWSTARVLRYNHKLKTDKKFRRNVRYKLTRQLNKDETQYEMSWFARKLLKKYDSDRVMLYLGVFGYGPIGVFLFYCLLTDFWFYTPFTMLLIGLMIGFLGRQVAVAFTLKRFGIEI